jgi:hypothetical protein
LVLFRQRRDQIAASRGAPLLAVIQEQGDGRVVLEAKIVQDSQCHDGVDHPGLLIAHAGAVCSLRVHAEWPSCRGSGSKYRVNVRNDENPALSGAMKHGHQVVRQSLDLGRFAAHVGAERFETIGEQRLDPGAPRDIPGSGIDIDDCLEQVEGIRAVGHRSLIDAVVSMGVCSGSGATQQAQSRGEHPRRPMWPHGVSLR